MKSSLSHRAGRETIIALLILAALASGCLRNDGPSAAVEPNYSVPLQNADSPPADVEPEEAPKKPVTESVMWQAKAPAVAMACLVESELPCLGTAQGGPLHVAYELPHANWTHALLNFTWTPAIPGQELGVGIYGCTPGCEEFEILGNWTTGPSPLTLDAPIPPASAAYPVVSILVWSNTHHYQDPALVFVNPEQPFLVEGAIHGVREP
jgi:hypothetical protein